MEAQEQDFELELMEEAAEESAPPEAFYLALKNALKQLEQAPAEMHV